MSTPESDSHARAGGEDQRAAAPEDIDADLGDLDDFDDDDLTDDDSSRGLEIAFTPRQILGGFALLAALLLLLRRRRRSDASND